MHAMLAYGDIDLVLSMNADTDTNSAYLTGAAGATAPAPGELGRTLSREYGATCCPGCRKTRTPVRWYC